jgi:Tol biopolymer transport system component
MKSVLIVTAGALLLVTGLAFGGQKQDDAERQLKAAMNTELVDGNFKAAIQQYQAIVTKFAGDRSIAADALIHMAECYRKLGDTESQKIYERVLRDYPDQKQAVAIARAHAAGTTPSPGVKGDRPVNLPLVDGFGTVSRDGRFLTYTDWSKGAVLMLHDVAAGTDRPLTSDSRSKGIFAEYSALSKDGKQVAFNLHGTYKTEELRIAALQGTGIPESRHVLQSDEIASIYPFDWSPDGKWIASRLIRKDHTSQIALVSAQDGAVRVVKSTGWSDREGKVFFSPDGKYLAYAVTNVDAADKSGIFIMVADGSRENSVVADSSFNQVMGWSPDGKYLLFASDRNGSVGLWAVPVTNGKAQGQPVLVKPEIASTWSLGVTDSGTLYTWKNTGSAYVQVSPLDLASGKLVGPSTGAFQRFIESRGRPEWSKDGKQLAFQSCGLLGGGPCSLSVWSATTGQVRSVMHHLNYFQYMKWSPDGRELLVRGTDLKGDSGMYKIDAATGATAPVINDARGYPQWARDGNAIYYKRGALIVRQDQATGAETEFVRTPSVANNNIFSISPDEQSIALVANQGPGSDVAVIRVETGQVRNIFHVNAPERINNDPLSWTPDNRAVLVVRSLGNSSKELWEIPTDGGQPRKLDIDIGDWTDGTFRLSPDGKQIAFVGTAGKTDNEIWALENVIPTTPKANK